MNLQIVPARTGLQWVRQGIRTFWRQPLAMTGLFFLFMASVSLLSILPVLGSVVALVLMPAFTLGLMAATQTATEGQFPMPGTLFIALKPGPNRKTMLQLGVAYAIGFMLIMGVSMLADGGQFARVYLGGEAISPETLSTQDLQAAAWVSMLLYIPMSMLFWHAPALVHWRGVPLLKSLFFSWMACWRNLGAFAIYLLAWMVVFLGAGLLALAVATVLGNPQLVMPVLMPLGLMVAAMFFTSMLFTVKDCFSASEPHLA